MKLLIVHLSDIHIAHENDNVLRRANVIARAASSMAVEVDLCVIALTGDTSAHGISTEFDVARRFLKRVKNELGRILKQRSSARNVRVYLVAAPGNHDCDLSGSELLRNSVVASAAKDPSLLLDREGVDLLTHAQNNYFEFLQTLESG